MEGFVLSSKIGFIVAAFLCGRDESFPRLESCIGLGNTLECIAVVILQFVAEHGFATESTHDL